MAIQRIIASGAIESTQTQRGVTHRSVRTYDYVGLSSDAKPTDCDAGATFWAIDTKVPYIFSGDNTNPATGDGWWEI